MSFELKFKIEKKFDKLGKEFDDLKRLFSELSASLASSSQQSRRKQHGEYFSCTVHVLHKEHVCRDELSYSAA